MTQHTPGPWRVDYDQRPDGADQILDANERTVAFIATPKEDHETDARLIAAAPAMLEALRALSGAASMTLRYGEQEDLAAARDKARAVLAEIEKETTQGKTNA